MGIGSVQQVNPLVSVKVVLGRKVIMDDWLLLGEREGGVGACSGSLELFGSAGSALARGWGSGVRNHLSGFKAAGTCFYDSDACVFLSLGA